MRLSRLSALAASLLLSASLSARAQTLDEAQALFDGGDVEGALTAFEASLRHGDSTPTRLARIHRQLGILHAAMGHDDEALASFERSLALDPAQPAPDELDPRQRELFRATAASRGDRALTVAVEVEPDGTTVAEVLGAPEGFVHETRAALGEESTRALGTRVSLTIPEAAWLGAQVWLAVTAHDEYGNTVATARERLARPTVIAAPGEDLAWVVVLVVSLAVAGAAAGILGWALTAEDGYAMPVLAW